MKLKTIKPLYLGGKTLVEGTPFITDEQHGRQLLAKKFAELHEGDDSPAVDLTADPATSKALTSDSLGSQEPVFQLKQLERGTWIIVDTSGEQVGAFAGTKAEATAELSRLVAGGEPLAAKDESGPVEDDDGAPPPAEEPPPAPQE